MNITLRHALASLLLGATVTTAVAAGHHTRHTGGLPVAETGFAQARQLDLDRKHQPRKRNVITEPQGELKYYDKNCAGTFATMGEMALYKDVFPGLVIWGQENKVYFQNLISVFPEDYYVEGTVEGNVITVPTGQMVSYYEEDGFGFCFGVLKTELGVEDGEEVYLFNYVPEIKSVEFIIGDDGSLTMKLPGEPFDGEQPSEYIAGIYYSDNYEYTGCGDFMQEYTPRPLQLVTMPAGADIIPYAYVDEFNFGHLIDVAFFGDYLYIRGLCSMLPEGTIRARVEGDKAYVPQDEYLGIYYDQFYIFTKVVYDNPDYDPDKEEDEGEDLTGNPPFIMAPEDVEFVLNIDRSTGVIYADTEGVYLSYHSDMNDIFNSLGYYGIFEIKPQTTYAGVPSNPVIVEYTTEWAPRQGFNDFFFLLSNFSKDGMVLDDNNLYYRIYVNGEPLVFVEQTIDNLLGKETVAYQGVPIETLYIPYLFDNNNDIFKYAENLFDIGIYTFDVETIGVQSAYLYENRLTLSDIVTLNTETGETTVTPVENEESGVEAVMDGEPTVKEYYRLDGTRVANPERGIYIEVTRSQGARPVVKKVIK